MTAKTAEGKRNRLFHGPRQWQSIPHMSLLWKRHCLIIRRDAFPSGTIYRSLTTGLLANPLARHEKAARISRTRVGRALMKVMHSSAMLAALSSRIPSRDSTGGLQRSSGSAFWKRRGATPHGCAFHTKFQLPRLELVLRGRPCISRCRWRPTTRTAPGERSLMRRLSGRQMLDHKSVAVPFAASQPICLGKRPPSATWPHPLDELSLPPAIPLWLVCTLHWLGSCVLVLTASPTSSLPPFSSSPRTSHLDTTHRQIHHSRHCSVRIST